MSEALDAGEVRRLLLRWYRRNRRDLPWRRTRDPYAIWISEAMLQQTRVETVIPYYERFLARFPTVRALAEADADDVLGAWAGLGYYSRARNLQRAAQVVADEHEGRLPDTAEGLRELPGIGRYTAGAVASIAFDRPEPVVDGNVARVLARLLEIREDVKRPAVSRRLWEEAEALVQGESPGDLNQALMELGATVCTPRSPRCLACPLVKGCAGRAAGDPEALPVKAARKAPRRVEAAAGLLVRRGRALAVRRPPSGLLGGLWELPGGDLAPRERPEDGLLRALRERVGLRVAGARQLGTVDHEFTHRRLRLHVFQCDTPEGRVRLEGFDAHRWLAPAGLAALPQGAVTRKALELLATDESR
ncbi:MAG: A/G-specific adenine glycosylase [Myxococcota bacterium]|nr:A/G-specific adenine glycosylase [Myxococcota bacterium]